MTSGVLLYGPPAVGKDTITRHLERIGPFEQFRRLKCGPGRSTGEVGTDRERDGRRAQGSREAGEEAGRNQETRRSQKARCGEEVKVDSQAGLG